MLSKVQTGQNSGQNFIHLLCSVRTCMCAQGGTLRGEHPYECRDSLQLGVLGALYIGHAYT
jgi:hypothetical protein